MERIDLFRQYYNHTLFPELNRLEQSRRRLVLLISLSVVFVLIILVLELIVDVLAFTLFMTIPLGFYLTYLFYKVQRFRLSFKPRVVNLINDFLDDHPHIQDLEYFPTKLISKSTFLDSKLFATEAPYYKGEDLFKGLIGELSFQMSELYVREYSKVRNRLNYVFRGVFMHAQFPHPLPGKVLVLPREFRQYLSRTVREFSILRGMRISGMVQPEFEDYFDTYFATEEGRELFEISSEAQKIISPEIQASLLHFRKRTDKPVYVSFIEGQLYIAVTENKNILEPSVHLTNTQFETVKEFFEDLQMLISLVRDFDRYH